MPLAPRLLVLAGLSSVAFACSKKSATADPSGQTLADAFSIICQAPANLPPDLRPDQRVWSMAQYLDSKVFNREARVFMSGLAAADPALRNTRLREKARQLGIQTCPLADEKPAMTHDDPGPPGDDTSGTSGTTTP